MFVVGGPCEAPRTFNMLSAESLEPGAPSSRFVVVESAIWDALGRKMQDLRLMVSDDKIALRCVFVLCFHGAVCSVEPQRSPDLPCPCRATHQHPRRHRLTASGVEANQRKADHAVSSTVLSACIDTSVLSSQQRAWRQELFKARIDALLGTYLLA